MLITSIISRALLLKSSLVCLITSSKSLPVWQVHFVNTRQNVMDFVRKSMTNYAKLMTIMRFSITIVTIKRNITSISGSFLRNITSH